MQGDLREAGVSINTKIWHLLRIAESDKGPQGKTARKIAENLMEKHRVEVTLEEKDEIIDHILLVKTEDRARILVMLHPLSNLHHCRFLLFPNPKAKCARVVLRGYRSNVEKCVGEYNRYEDRITAMADEREGRGKFNTIMRRGFRLGCAVAIQEYVSAKLEAQKEKQARKDRRWKKQEAKRTKKEYEEHLRSVEAGDPDAIVAMVPYRKKFVGGQFESSSRTFVSGSDESGGESLDFNIETIDPDPPISSYMLREGYLTMKASLR